MYVLTARNIMKIFIIFQKYYLQMWKTEQSTCINIERLFSKQSPTQQKFGIKLPKYLFSKLYN